MHHDLPARALRCFTWGQVLLVLDLTLSFKSGGAGFRFDVLNDFAGMLLIARGAWLLLSSPLLRELVVQRTLVGIAVGVSTFRALAGHLILPDPPLGFFWSAWDLIDTATTLVLLNLLRHLCAGSGLPASERQAARALRATCLLQAVPTALWSAVELYARLWPSTSVSMPRWLGVALFVTQLVPAASFIAVLRTARNENPGPSGPSTPRPWLAGAAVVALLALWPPSLAGELYWQLRIRNRDAICGSTSGTSWTLEGGRTVEIRSGTNGNDELRVVVVSERAGHEGRPVMPGSLLNAVEVRHRYPADEAASGLFIDGEQRPLPKNTALVYVSDVQHVRVFEVPEAEAKEYLDLQRGPALEDALRRLRER